MSRRNNNKILLSNQPRRRLKIVSDLFMEVWRDKAGFIGMTSFTSGFHLVLIMGIIITIAHDLIAGMAIYAGHSLLVMNIGRKTKIEAVTGQPIGRKPALFIRRTVSFGFINADI